MDLALKGFLLSLSLCLDLGLVNVALIRTALREGTRPAVALGLGSALGDLLYACASVAALALVLEHQGVRLVLWLGGTLVLAWFALRMLRETLHPHAPDLRAGDLPQRSCATGFARGLALALASPSAILWFAAVGGSIIAAHARGPGALVPFLAGFALAGVLWGAGVAVAVGRTRHFASERLLRLAALASALLFVYFALDVFVRGYREFVLR